MEVVNVGAVLEMSKLGLPFLRKGNNPSETKAIKVFLSWKLCVGAILGHIHYRICYPNFDGGLLKVFESAFPREGNYPALPFLVLFRLPMIGKGQLQLSNLAPFLWKPAHKIRLYWIAELSYKFRLLNPESETTHLCVLAHFVWVMTFLALGLHFGSLS